MIYVKTIRAATAAPLLWLLLSLSGIAHAQNGPQPKLPTVPLTAGMHVIQAELAITPMQQAIGMMQRRSMGANEGMLFVYDAPERLCFWMRNTLLPLSIAFVADDGRIVGLADMQPLDETSHCTPEPARFALEMNQGWFKKRGLKKGDRLRGAPFGS
ncbi:MAG: DUF192 domain-containing protein [Burkholderiaceae bacterium]|nr:DUF192 domain-containing protein [Burkholderiaceae bacterium]